MPRTTNILLPDHLTWTLVALGLWSPDPWKDNFSTFFLVPTLAQKLALIRPVADMAAKMCNWNPYGSFNESRCKMPIKMAVLPASIEVYYLKEQSPLSVAIQYPGGKTKHPFPSDWPSGSSWGMLGGTWVGVMIVGCFMVFMPWKFEQKNSSMDL